MKSTRGFTVIELVFIIVLLGVASVIFFVQKNNLEVSAHDAQRKTAINAMYYSLEEVYYPQHGSYPRTLTPEALPSVDPELFKDPAGVRIGEADSDYRYEGVNCDGDTCQRYTLRASLEREDDFVKENRN